MDKIYFSESKAISSITIKWSDYPSLKESKIKELKEQGFTKDEITDFFQSVDTVELELFYHPHNGIFAVEADAVDNTPLNSPYDTSVELVEKPMFSIENHIQVIEQIWNASKTLRLGQIIFNHFLNSDMVEDEVKEKTRSLAGTVYDCYYQDNRIFSFLMQILNQDDYETFATSKFIMKAHK